MNAKQLADLSLGIEAHLVTTLREVCANATPDPQEQLNIGGAVICLLMRHYMLASADPHGWLEGAIKSVLQP